VLCQLHEDNQIARWPVSEGTSAVGWGSITARIVWRVLSDWCAFEKSHSTLPSETLKPIKSGGRSSSEKSFDPADKMISST